MGVVRRRLELEQLAEGPPRQLVLAAVEVRPAERLEDRLAVRLETVGPLEHDRGLRVVAPPKELLAALQQVVGGLAFVRRGRLHGPMVARTA